VVRFAGGALGEIALRLARAYSITSSARASSIGGTSMPSALAVLRVITSSTLVTAVLADQPASRR